MTFPALSESYWEEGKGWGYFKKAGIDLRRRKKRVRIQVKIFFARGKEEWDG